MARPYIACDADRRRPRYQIRGSRAEGWYIVDTFRREIELEGGSGYRTLVNLASALNAGELISVRQERGQ